MYLIRVYYLKNIKSFNSTTKDNFKEWEKDLSKHRSKDDIQMANKCRKWCPTLLLIREKEIKTTVGSTEHLLCYAMLCYAKSLQSCPTLCDPIDSSPPGSAIPGILQARTLEWVAISFPDARKWKVKVKSLSRVRLCDPMNRSMPGLPVHHQLPEFTQTHIHRVSDATQPSHPLSSPSPPAPNPSQHHSLVQWVNSSHEVAKVLEIQL